MAWFKHLSRFGLLAVVLTLAISFNVVAQVSPQSSSSSLAREVENAFRPPKRGIRGLIDPRQSGTILLERCTVGRLTLTALVPLPEGETVAESPTVFWYMPRISDEGEFASAPELEFTLKDANDQNIYSAKYPLTKSTNGIVGTPGIMSLSLAKPYALAVGQKYTWQLKLTCDSKSVDRSSDQLIEGGIKRVALDPTLASRLQQATPEERILLYARAKLWYEMLAELVRLRRDRPDDPNLADAWEKLFVAVGLNRVSKVPIITNNP